MLVLKERMFHEGYRVKFSGEGCPISDYFLLNEWGIDVFYVPLENKKFIKMFESVIYFFSLFERILTKVKSKIDDEIDFLINEDDEFEENRNLMDSFVIKLKEIMSNYQKLKSNLKIMREI